MELSGYEKPAPTLEIFENNNANDRGPNSINQPGFAHIAVSEDSAEDAKDKVIEHGDSAMGDLVSLTLQDHRTVTLNYMRDTEGNIIELQKWK
ncbi:MAG: hypothetical protein CMI18_04675 [Opitutaceae bacterium]|nr:hypothetical protein [Opitutaceae bacterium]